MPKKKRLSGQHIANRSRRRESLLLLGGYVLSAAAAANTAKAVVAQQADNDNRDNDPDPDILTSSNTAASTVIRTDFRHVLPSIYLSYHSNCSHFRTRTAAGTK
ncbi:MAG: hypothetical protein SO147_01280 [Clostridia bacterium]|nr:hypothetical protein [Clostridia bacterium]